MSNIRETLIGKVNSLELLNKIFEKGLQNLFPQMCVALRIFIPYQSLCLKENAPLANYPSLKIVYDLLWGKTAYQPLQCSHWSVIWQENSIMTVS